MTQSRGQGESLQTLIEIEKALRAASRPVKPASPPRLDPKKLQQELAELEALLKRGRKSEQE